MEHLQTTLSNLLREGKQLTLTWDGGGDEVFFKLFLDGEEVSEEYGEDFVINLEEHIIKHTEISGVGEMSLEGTGQLHLRNGQIVLVSHERMYEVIDYEKDSGEPIHAEGPPFEEQQTFLLFPRQ